MMDLDRSQPGRAPSQPDDIRNYQAQGVIAQIAAVLVNGLGYAARLKKSLRVGSGSATLAAIDGNDGQIAADGTLAGVYLSDRGANTNYILLYENGTFRINSSQSGDLWLMNATTGIWAPVTTTPTLSGTWAVSGGRTVRYWRDWHGLVHLEGQVASGTIPSTIFTLNSGFRPLQQGNFVVDSNSAFGEVLISTAGVVTANVGSATSVSLDGITFRTT